jgi:hypothetical protein
MTRHAEGHLLIYLWFKRSTIHTGVGKYFKILELYILFFKSLEYYKFYSRTLLTFSVGQQQCCQLCTPSHVYSLSTMYHFQGDSLEHSDKAKPLFLRVSKWKTRKEV